MLGEHSMDFFTKKEKENLFTILGTINTAYIRRPNFEESGLKNKIFEKTSFLDSYSPLLSERIYCIENDIIDRPKCQTCSGPVKFMIQNGKKYNEFCSQSCRRQKVKWGGNGLAMAQTVTDRKSEFVKFAHQNDKIDKQATNIFVHNRIENNKLSNWKFTNREDYVKHQLELSTILKTTNFLKSNIEKFDFKWSERFFLFSKGFKQLPLCEFCNGKTKYRNFVDGYLCKSCNVKMGKYRKFRPVLKQIINEQQFKIVQEPVNLNSGPFSLKCNECSDTHKYWLNDGHSNSEILCKTCKPNGVSQKEIRLRDFISQYIEITPNFRFNEHKFGGREIDILIPSKNIGIEFNGNYWHSEISGNTPQKYHLDKTNLCKVNGIRLIHVFEDEWDNNEEIVKSRLLHILNLNKSTRLFARKCEVKEIDSKIKNKFLKQFHIQGEDRSKIKLGLFYEEELVSVMTFSKQRIALGKKSSDDEWELSRFCQNDNYSIVGAAGKLLSYFKKNYKWNEVISYADLRWSDGNLYNKLGFDLTHQSKPNYWYLNNGRREHRYKYAKHNLPRILENFDPSQTEWQNMQNHGFDRIWDCGNLVYLLKNPDK